MGKRKRDLDDERKTKKRKKQISLFHEVCLEINPILIETEGNFFEKLKKFLHEKLSSDSDFYSFLELQLLKFDKEPEKVKNVLKAKILKKLSSVIEERIKKVSRAISRISGPISQVILVDPVVLKKSGIIYEKLQLIQALEYKKECPVTKKKLENLRNIEEHFVPAFDKKNQITQFVEEFKEQTQNIWKCIKSFPFSTKKEEEFKPLQIQLYENAKSLIAIEQDFIETGFFDEIEIHQKRIELMKLFSLEDAKTIWKENHKLVEFFFQYDREIEGFNTFSTISKTFFSDEEIKNDKEIEKFFYETLMRLIENKDSQYLMKATTSFCKEHHLEIPEVVKFNINLLLKENKTKAIALYQKFAHFFAEETEENLLFRIKVLENQVLRCKSFFTLGNLYFRESKFEKAEEYYQKTRTICLGNSIFARRFQYDVVENLVKTKEVLKKSKKEIANEYLVLGRTCCSKEMKRINFKKAFELDENDETKKHYFSFLINSKEQEDKEELLRRTDFFTSHLLKKNEVLENRIEFLENNDVIMKRFDIEFNEFNDSTIFRVLDFNGLRIKIDFSNKVEGFNICSTGNNIIFDYLSLKLHYERKTKSIIKFINQKKKIFKPNVRYELASDRLLENFKDEEKATLFDNGKKYFQFSLEIINLRSIW